jgi:hypothetical protein
MSGATIRAYRDTWKLLLTFLSDKVHVPAHRLQLAHATPANVVAFLEHLEQERGNAAATRNLRLAAIKSDGCAALLDLMRFMPGNGNGLLLTGADHFADMLHEAAQGNPAVEVYWALMLELYRMRGQQAEFERAALEWLCAVGGVITATLVFVHGGLLIANGHDGAAALLDYLDPARHLAAAVPSYVADRAILTRPVGLTILWLAIAAAAWRVAGAIGPRSRGASQLAASAIGATSLMIAAVAAPVFGSTDRFTTPVESLPGAGSLPGTVIPSFGIALDGDRTAGLRAADPPVVARVREGRTYLDLRTVDPADDATLTKALTALSPARP